MNDIVRIDADQMRLMLQPHKRPRGRYIARMENGEWVGVDTTAYANTWICKKYSGSFQDVIELMIPFTGERRRPLENLAGYRGRHEGTVRIPYSKMKEADGKSPRHRNAGSTITTK